MAKQKPHRKRSIPNWADDDKPREKLLSLGSPYLSDAELLAIILRSGARDKSAVALARDMLAIHDNSLMRLEESDIRDLMQFNGIGEAKAVAIKAALELGRRSQMTEVEKQPIINSSKLAFEVVSRDLGIQKHEECWALYLNRRNQLIAKERLSSGGVSGTVVDVRIILKKAIEKLASGVILCHNHPSGNLQASKADRAITSKLLEACRYLDLKLIDHLIVTRSGYFSFADEGELI